MADPRTQPPPTSKDIEHRMSWVMWIAKLVLTVLVFPYRRTFKLYTWKPLEEIRAAEGDRRLWLARVKEFKANKYTELQSVQVAASFCAAATLSTLSWSKMQLPIWAADALWFSSLICSIWAVITSIQTKSILDDLPDKDELTMSLPELELKRTKRVVLRYRKRPGLGHWAMVFVWQFPSMTMSYAWCTFLAGLTLYICTPFIRSGRWSNQHKIAIAYLVVFGLGFCTYLFNSVFVYLGERDYERSTQSTRINTMDMESGLPLDPPHARVSGAGAAEPSDDDPPLMRLVARVEGVNRLDRPRKQLLI